MDVSENERNEAINCFVAAKRMLPTSENENENTLEFNGSANHSIELIPPLSSAEISDTESESDTGSLYGYYDKIVKENIKSEGSTDENLLFIKSDGRTASFAGSTNSLHSFQDSLTSNDQIFIRNQKNFLYANLPTKHIKWEILTILVLLCGCCGKYFDFTHLYLIGEKLLDEKQFKILCTLVVTLCFISRIVFGVLCDRFSIAKFIFICTNLLCAISSFLFLFGNPTWWIICGCFISISIPGTWVSLVGILARWIPISRQGRIFSIFQSCFFVCDMISFIAVEIILNFSINESSSVYIIIISIICLISSIPAFKLLNFSPKKCYLLEPPTMKSSKSNYKPKSLKEIFLPLYKNKSLWIMCLLALEIYGTCQYFLIYSWQYILTCYCYPGGDKYSDCMNSNEDEFFAVLISLCFPICGILSCIFVGILKDGISSKHRSILLVTFTIAFLLFFMAMHYLLKVSSIAMAIILICCCGLTILGPYSLVSGAFCVDIGGKYRSSTVSGLVDAFGSVSSFIVVCIGYFYGSNSTQSFLVIFILTCCTILTSLALWYFDYEKEKQDSFIEKFLDTDEDHMYILDTSIPTVQRYNSFNAINVNM